MSLEDDIRTLKTELAEHKGTVSCLEGIERVLSGATDVDSWTAVDVLRTLDPAGVAAEIRGQALVDRSLAWFERTRNVLILLPIVLTWAGLWYAAAGYHSAVEADEGLLSRPFLLLWQEDFHGHVSWWVPSFLLRLSHIAFIDVVLLGGVGVLTWIIHTRINVHQAVQEDKARKIEDRLQSVAFLASLEIGKRRSRGVDLTPFRTAVDALLSEMKDHRLKLHELFLQQHRGVVAQLDAVKAALDPLVTELRDERLEWKQQGEERNRELRQHVEDFGKTAEGLLNELRAEREILTELSKDRGKEAADLRRFASDLKSGAGRLERASSGVSASVSVLTQASVELERLVRALQEGQEGMKASFGRTADELKSLSEVQGTAVHKVADVIGGLSESAENMVPATARLAGHVEELRGEIIDLRAQLVNERGAYQAVADRAGETAKSLSDALAGMSEVRVELSKSAGAMDALLERLAEVPRGFGAAASAQVSAAEATTKAATGIAGSVAVVDGRLMQAATDFASAARIMSTMIGGIERLAVTNEALQKQAQRVIETAPTKEILVDAWQRVQNEGVAKLSRAIADGRAPAVKDGRPRSLWDRFLGR